MKKSEEKERLMRREEIGRIKNEIDLLRDSLIERGKKLVYLEQELHELMNEEMKSQERAKKKAK